jgi:hypothetical protein
VALRSSVPQSGAQPDARPSAPLAGAFFSTGIRMTKADSYRKRAKSLGKRMSNRQVQHTTPVGRKQKALNDMADNEDWLDGKIKPKA